MPNTVKYVVEVSTDSLYDGVAENASGKSIVKELTSTPDTIYDLTGATKYYIRLRGVSAEGKSSNWKYLDSYSFKTKSEQIITNVVPASTTADVYFTAGKTIDAAYIYEDKADSIKQAVTASEVEAGHLVLKGLKDNTSYTVKLWNGTAVRGTMAFKTTEAYPDGYQIITLTEDADLNTLLASATNDKVVVVFPQGLDYKTPLGEDGKNKTPLIPANINSIYFWGAAGEAQPTFHTMGVQLDGSTDKGVVRFYNLNLINDNKTADYVMNINAAVNINSIEIEGCNISDTRGIIRFQSIGSECAVKNVIINNCVMDNIGSYGLFNAKGQTKLKLGALTISNSTIYGVEAGALVNVQHDGLLINVDHCTIYNCVQTGKSLFDVNKITSTQLIIENSLIGPFYAADDTTIKGMSVKNQQNVSTTYYTNDLNWNAGYEIGDEINGSSTDLWTDPAIGDFTIKSAFKSQYEAYGDPRWKETD